MVFILDCDILEMNQKMDFYINNLIFFANKSKVCAFLILSMVKS